jgi:SRSO17 transposase
MNQIHAARSDGAPVRAVPRADDLAGRQPMPEHDPHWLERLDAYAEQYRSAFRRREQARWAAVYLQGLLLPGGRKNIGTMARTVSVPPDLPVEDITQALQHFVNQSPWDETEVLRRYRALLGSALPAGESVLAVEDVALVKQGRHSVGVQRQYSSALGFKANCQAAVGLFHISATAALPLALQLYLPRSWTQSPERLDAVGVPEVYRTFRSKPTIALELLDTLRQENWTPSLIVGASAYGSDRTFREALAARGLAYLLEAPASESETAWRTGSGALASNLAPDADAARVARAWQCREAVRPLLHSLQEDLGLDHFEGRSWRGFHHHACLVTLAFGFRVL